jgi:soluble lytic murein transglycosylase
MKRFLCLILFVTCCLPIYSGDINGKSCLKKGKNELESGKYEDAIASLSAAEKELPLLGDYAMLWLSDAYHETGKHKESLKTIRILLDKYPLSPLIKKARVREIKEAEEVPEENIQQIYESYLKDYSDDTEVRFLYAQWLKKDGRKDTAKSVFKDIYIDAGPFSGPAYSELSSSDISAKDLVNRASNLMNARDFRGAESALRSAMAKDDGSLKKEILKDLGFSLFRQKKYSKAAEVFKEANNIYWQVRSLYRIGEKKAFNSALGELLKSGDKRAGRILISIASDQRREGKIEEALKTYQNVIEQYPSRTEDALWGIGWTYFLTGEYKRAANIFTRLYATYDEIRYLYWKARSLEADGEDAGSIYHAIMEKGLNFYSIMSYIRTGGAMEESHAPETPKFSGIFTTQGKRFTVTPQKNDRIEALLDLGFRKEALSALIYVSKHLSSIDDLLYICSKFQELGEYKYSVRLAVKVPYIEEFHPFQYPFAYQDIVETLSERYNVDPELVFSVAREESRFDPEASSMAGALGLMQVMPQTAYRLNNNLRLDVHSPRGILDVKNNFHFGIYLLSDLIKEFGSYSYALAAYNAGRDNVRKWLQNGNHKSADEFIEDIPYPETRNYVKKVITTFFEYKRISSTGGSMIKISLEKL